MSKAAGPRISSLRFLFYAALHCPAENVTFAKGESFLFLLALLSLFPVSLSVFCFPRMLWRFGWTVWFFRLMGGWR